MRWEVWGSSEKADSQERLGKAYGEPDLDVLF